MISDVRNQFARLDPNSQIDEVASILALRFNEVEGQRLPEEYSNTSAFPTERKLSPDGCTLRTSESIDKKLRKFS